MKPMTGFFSVIKASFNKEKMAAQIGEEPEVPTNPRVEPFQIVGKV